MKNIAKLVALSFLLMLASCVPTLHPLYTDQDVIFDPALLGVWAEKNSKETWAFIKASEKQYKLIYTDEDGKKGEFIAHLLKVEGKMFLDLVPAKLALQQNDFYRDHFLPTHTFVLVSQIEPTPRISYLEPKWLTEFLAKNPTAIRHEKVGDGVLLTADTKELQKFLLTHLKTEGAFSQSSDWERRKGGR